MQILFFLFFNALVHEADAVVIIFQHIQFYPVLGLRKGGVTKWLSKENIVVVSTICFALLQFTNWIMDVRSTAMATISSLPGF